MTHVKKSMINYYKYFSVGSMQNIINVTLTEAFDAYAIAENVKADGEAVAVANAHAQARAFRAGLVAAKAVNNAATYVSEAPFRGNRYGRRTAAAEAQANVRVAAFNALTVAANRTAIAVVDANVKTDIYRYVAFTRAESACAYHTGCATSARARAAKQYREYYHTSVHTQTPGNVQATNAARADVLIHEDYAAHAHKLACELKFDWME